MAKNSKRRRAHHCKTCKSEQAQIGGEKGPFFFFLSENLFLVFWKKPRGKKIKKDQNNTELQNRQACKGWPKLLVCDTRRACDSEAARRACDSELQTVLQVNVSQTTNCWPSPRFGLHRFESSCFVHALFLADLPCSSMLDLTDLAKKKKRPLIPDSGHLVLSEICNLGRPALGALFWPLENTKNFEWEVGSRLD